MTHHKYPTSAMLGDYLRAAAGLIPTVVILVTFSVGPAAATVLGGLACLFAVFAIRTGIRHGTHLEVTEGALRALGLTRSSISWSELERMKLAYYSTHRDGRGGWMQLELCSGSSVLRIDSRIEGFTELVEASAKAADARHTFLSAATSANLQALGIKFCAVVSEGREATRGTA
jgi:hypothetical protein